MMGRYLAVVGIMIAVLAGLAVWWKPPLQEMRESVESNIADYARTAQSAGKAMPEITSVESNDWVVAVSHVAKAGDHIFSCMGAYHVTVCQSPD